MMIISDATIWSVTYGRNWQLAKAKARANETYIVQA